MKSVAITFIKMEVADWDNSSIFNITKAVF